MTYIPAANQPEFVGVYVTTVTDQVGTVAANNYLAIMNPATSKRLHVSLYLSVGAYAQGVSSTPVSLQGHRITAVSGGALATGANIDRFVTTMPDPQTQIYSGNPTIVLDKYLGNYVIEPPFSTGAGGGIVKSVTTVPGASFVLQPGQGLSFGTSSGNTNQLWNIEYIWGEVQL